MELKDKHYKNSKELPIDFTPAELPKAEQYYSELIILFCTCLFSAYLFFLLAVGISNIGDLFSWPMILPALVYAWPAFIACAFLFEKLVDSYSKKMSIIISLVVCIPLVFLLLMWFLSS